MNRDEYFARRTRIRDDWREGDQLLRRLTAEQQWALHDFYLLAHDVSEKDVLARRNATVKSEPSLSKAAGFAYRSFVVLRTQTRQHVNG